MSIRSVGNNGVIQVDYSKLIGRGLFCRVYSGVFDKRDVAVKMIEQRRGDTFAREIESLRQLEHPNIVRYLYTDEDWECVYIVLEKCRYPLQDMLSGPQTLPENVLDILKQISEGVRYLHCKNIIHRDIHPSNILISDVDGLPRFRISDFGVVKDKQPGDTSISSSGIRGTLPYISPEVLKGEHINEMTDIFSLGLVFFTVLSKGKSPFGNDTIDIVKAICDGEDPDLSALTEIYNGYAFPLIRTMLQYQKNERPGINSVLTHYLFWNKEKTLNFIQKVSDDLNDNKMSGMQNKVEKYWGQIVDKQTDTQARDWTSVMFQGMTKDQIEILKKDFKKYPSDKTSVQGLLRQIRNWNHHYGSKEESLRNLIGQITSEMLNFMTTRFPKLLPSVYEVYKTMKGKDGFSQFC